MARPKLHQLLDGVSAWNENLWFETQEALEGLSVEDLKRIITAAGKGDLVPSGVRGVKHQLLSMIHAMSPIELLDAYDVARGKRVAGNGQSAGLDQAHWPETVTLQFTLPSTALKDPEFLSALRRHI